jgi:hypothetical protein
LNEEYQLQVFGNNVLEKIFGPKIVEAGNLRILHTGEISDL